MPKPIKRERYVDGEMQSYYEQPYRIHQYWENNEDYVKPSFKSANRFHSATQKSTIFGGELSDIGIRQELKRNEKYHRELLEEIKKLGNYYNK